MSGKFIMNGIEYLGGGSGSGGGGNVDDVYVNGTSVLDEDKIAQIISYKEVTQSEYNALPDTKYTDGIAYFIKDSVEAEGYPPLIYSTGERQVGVWVDGKPLYEKTYIQTYTNGGSKQINISDIPFDYIWMSEGSAAIAYNNSVQTLNYGTGGNYTVFALVNRNGKFIEAVCNGNEWMPWTVYITLRYTKTTDTAGQGIWAGNGAMAHHYSTDEKIIGTWIDGKPLYEKTLELNSPSGNGTLADLSSYSIDTMVNIRWLLYTSTGDIIYGSSSYYQVIQVYFTISSGLIKMDYNNASWATSRPMKVVIQYTKTTD